ncbi:MAG: hypothetical protein B7Y12_01940 [Rhizobiales bacterium 24-66-13]|jgi:hypothetical protein|nr:MAG: hypothetical protein B7Y61_00975 [Rhizobiales bacterium 35-66-30]OYZ82777.1 MAG: hypothetical protein B7Y12_01940 [Rhizobiales bacterium 24-66-13]OZB11810.1 MAG: hypothetical protein B7X67_01920 [Rhizobiales bacterium 39-66-18]HQS09520.1 hypothetical protein [Xanthobacteraceae bacterium]HQS46818.1 hypothetical protein [Xanthobacteraceae bacterium]
MMRAFGVASIFALAICAQAGARELTDAEKKIITADIGEQLIDPFSAQYEWTQFNGQKLYCGRVAWKNEYGAYTGFRVFYAAPKRVEGGLIAEFFPTSFAALSLRGEEEVWQNCKAFAADPSLLNELPDTVILAMTKSAGRPKWPGLR